MTPEERKELLNSIATKQEEIQAAIDAKASNSELVELKQSITELTEKSKGLEEVKGLKASIEQIEDVMKKQGEEIAKSKSNSVVSKATSLAGEFTKAIRENEQILKDLKSATSSTGMNTILVKAAGTMTTANYSGGTVGLSDLEVGVTRVQRRQPFLRELVNSGTTSSKYVVWVEQSAPDGGAGMTGEGLAKSQADFDLVESSMEVRKITAYIKVSKEMIDDISFVEAEIRNELVELIQLQLDAQILSGAGTGVTMKGIDAYATTFAAGAFANAIESANNFDVLRVAINQIEIENFMPNYIVLHPTDAAAMDLVKATDNNYILPPFISQNGTVVKGLPVITNTGVTVGNFLVGDFTKSNLRVREDITLAVGYENDDFTKNLVTILGEARAVHYIKANQTKAFVKGVFATAKAALETA